MISKYLILVLAATFLLFGGCKKQTRVDSLPAYMKWLNDEHNGLVKIRYVNGIEMKVKYLPAEYLANTEFSRSPEYSHSRKDSILNTYKNSICFMLTLAPDEREKKGGDVMMRSVASYKDYASRVNDMNFKMEEFITLKAANKEYRPVLSSLENVYGLDAGRNIMLVFVPDKEGANLLIQADQLDFEYADELFQLGTNHFVFSGKDIKNVPAFNFE